MSDGESEREECSSLAAWTFDSKIIVVFETMPCEMGLLPNRLTLLVFFLHDNPANNARVKALEGSTSCRYRVCVLMRREATLKIHF